VRLDHGQATDRIFFVPVYDFANASVLVDRGQHLDLDLQETPTNLRPLSSLPTFQVSSSLSSPSFGLYVPVFPLVSHPYALLLTLAF
jgi:hypothetical protein